MRERAASKGDPSDGRDGFLRPLFGDVALVTLVCHQRVEAPKLQVSLEDHAFAVSIGGIDDDFAVFGVVAERSHATDPTPLALGGRNLVADTIGGELALE